MRTDARCLLSPDVSEFVWKFKMGDYFTSCFYHLKSISFFIKVDHCSLDLGVSAFHRYTMHDWKTFNCLIDVSSLGSQGYIMLYFALIN